MAKLHKLFTKHDKNRFLIWWHKAFSLYNLPHYCGRIFWIPWLQISRKFLYLFDYIINWLGSYAISFISVILMPILNLRRRDDKEHKFINYQHSLILNNMFHYELNILKWICQISNILFVVLLLSFSVDSTTYVSKYNLKRQIYLVSIWMCSLSIHQNDTFIF